ncbi:MAG: prepilin-type N-terminal cleavage/methylation domain-containing protein [Candidatus Levybacteria bacterium]|nr:prepilin-type N-terminal cleavage/methylation domain-containing protein [Candidatus Levybacteria bacterium]
MKRGFTLIELILVVAIVGIFTTAILAVVNPSQQVLKANDGRRKSDLSQIQRGLEAYYQDNGRYPLASGQKIYTTALIDWGTSWQPYMNVLPKDPTSSRQYIYYVSSDGQSYVVYASLERGTVDPQACNGGSACATIATFGISATACGGTCNYAVSSPDINP